eukprot:1181389-Prorocentrum_minimum.AAC.1
MFEIDEYVKPSTTEKSLQALRPAFKRDGSVTAGACRTTPTHPPARARSCRRFTVQRARSAPKRVFTGRLSHRLTRRQPSAIDLWGIYRSERRVYPTLCKRAPTVAFPISCFVVLPRVQPNRDTKGSPNRDTKGSSAAQQGH